MNCDYGSREKLEEMNQKITARKASESKKLKEKISFRELKSDFQLGNQDAP